MTGRQGRTWSGQPARSEEDELKNKKSRKAGGRLRALFGSKEEGDSLHPVAKESGYNGGSNVGVDEQSGSEGVDPDPVTPEKR